MLTHTKTLIESDGGVSNYFRDGYKFARITSHQRGGCLCSTQITLRNITTAETKIVESTSRSHAGDTMAAYLDSLWTKHLG